MRTGTLVVIGPSAMSVDFGVKVIVGTISVPRRVMYVRCVVSGSHHVVHTFFVAFVKTHAGIEPKSNVDDLRAVWFNHAVIPGS